MKTWKRIVCCILAALAAAALFGFGAAMVNAASLWLILLAAASAGGLCLCFVQRPGLFTGGKKREGVGVQLTAFACAALLLTLGIELFGCNYLSFVTRNNLPQELPLDEFMDSLDSYSFDDEPILIDPDDEGFFLLHMEDIDTETTSLGVVLEGESLWPVKLNVSLRDDASAYKDAAANQTVLIPQSDDLSMWQGILYSNGPIHDLYLNFDVRHYATDEVYVSQVILNPQIAVRWQPLRMGVCFLALWIALFLLRYPWLGIAYRPHSLRHRALLAACLLLTMALYGVLAVHSMPVADRNLHGITLEEAAQNFDDSYAQLFLAFRQGQTSLLIEPSQQLLELDNPYDISQRLDPYADEPISTLFDYALYDGHYYVYFGMGPIWLVYYPYFLLTGLVPAQSMTALWLGLLAVPLVFWAVCGFARRWCKKPNLVLLCLSCLAVCFTAAGPMLITSASRYENVVLANVAMMAGAIGFGYHAVARRDGWQRGALFALCGVCFGLQGMCRSNTLLLTTAVLAPAFVGVLTQKGRALSKRMGDGACFLLPALAGVAMVMGYNAIRFGSVAEFGQTYQLTLEDIRYNSFRMEQIIPAWVHYLLDQPVLTATFPYLKLQNVYTNLTGNFFWNDRNVGILAYPLMLFSLLCPAALYRDGDEPSCLAVQRKWSLWTPMVMALILMEVSYFYAGIHMRYVYDFLLTFGLVAAVCGLRLTSRQDGPAAGALGALFALACLVSCWMGLMFAFANERLFIYRFDTEWYIRLTRMFYPYC